MSAVACGDADGPTRSNERESLNHRHRPRLVIDTNVLLDLWLFHDPEVQALRRAIEASHVSLLRTEETFAELADVLQRPKFGLDEARQAALLERWTGCSEALRSVTAAPLQCRDRHDQKFLDAAFSGRADVLLTRDGALLELSRRAAALGLRIERPIAALSYDAPVASEVV